MSYAFSRKLPQVVPRRQNPLRSPSPVVAFGLARLGSDIRTSGRVNCTIGESARFGPSSYLEIAAYGY